MESHLSWSKSLEAVLSDRPALDAFQKWLAEFSSPQYLDLYFAIRAYERMALEGKPEKNQLAKSIYTKFLSSRTGNCEVIPSRYRSPIGEKIRRNEELDARIFAGCSSYVFDFLRLQHEEFVRSDEFIEAFNNKMTSSSSDDGHAPSHHHHHHHHQNTVERRRRSAAQAATQLTAEALLRSKNDRHSKLGETKLEKMYPSSRQPYVCNATTSHNDSAVSSSFSADTPSSHRAHRLRHVREEQARENTNTFTVPRVDKDHRQSDGSQQFDHSSESGRRFFAMEVTKKLMKHLDKTKLNEKMEKQINDIQECRYSTIDMVNGTEADLGKIDEDEELDDYLKMKMTDDSQKGSAARSPKNANGDKNQGKEAVKNSTIPRESPREIHLLHNTMRPRRSKEYSLDTHTIPRHHQIDRMSQSMSLGGGPTSSAYSTSSSTYSRDSFAPSPMTRHHHSSHHHHPSTSSKSSQFYDSSGIGSMAPSAFSATSSEPRESSRRHRKSIPTSFMMSQSMTTPRKHKTGRNLSNLITISYVGPDKVPVVAHVPNDGPMTLSEFKRHFALSTTNQQIFFKTECEDGSAPFQLLLIKEEQHLLPVFEGRIAAELR